MTINKYNAIRMLKFFTVALFHLTFAVGIAKANDNIKVSSAPSGVLLNSNFKVRVRAPGGVWRALPAYTVIVDRMAANDHSPQNSSMAYFDFSGKVEVEVTYTKTTVRKARIRPLSYQINSLLSGNKVSFTLTKPANLSVEVNGDIFDNLQLFANPIEDSLPSSKDTNVIYFSPGLHEITGGVLKVPSGKTVYIAGGAVVKGQILIEKVHDVHIIGHGILEPGSGKGIKIVWSKNVTISGLICGQCFTGGSENVTISNVKTISYWKWGDGMNVVSSKNVLFDGVFNRNSDDCTTIYGSRGEFYGDCKNITMKNSTLWADVAHPILIGTHGSTPNPNVLEHIIYQNIDILEHTEYQYDYQGCLSLNAGDSNLIKDVQFKDIRIENFRHGQLINIRVFFNSKYCTSPGRGVEDVLFKNIIYNGDNALTSIIAGYDERREVKNITFENLTINGKTIYDQMPGKPGWYKTSDFAGIFVGEHVKNIKFLKSAHD